MSFCNFDRAVEVFSDEEGIEKSISGFEVGRSFGRRRKTGGEDEVIDLNGNRRFKV